MQFSDPISSKFFEHCMVFTTLMESRFSEIRNQVQLTFQKKPEAVLLCQKFHCKLESFTVNEWKCRHLESSRWPEHCLPILISRERSSHELLFGSSALSWIVKLFEQSFEFSYFPFQVFIFCLNHLPKLLVDANCHLVHFVTNSFRWQEQERLQIMHMYTCASPSRRCLKIKILQKNLFLQVYSCIFRVLI